MKNSEGGVKCRRKLKINMLAYLATMKISHKNGFMTF